MSAQFRGAWVLWGLLSLGHGIGTSVGTVVHCKPVFYFWNRRRPGTCLNLTSLLVISSMVNIVTDIRILILPMPTIWRLGQISNPQKLAVSSIFLFGGLYVLTPAN